MFDDSVNTATDKLVNEEATRNQRVYGTRIRV